MLIFHTIFSMIKKQRKSTIETEEESQMAKMMEDFMQDVQLSGDEASFQNFSKFFEFF